MTRKEWFRKGAHNVLIGIDQLANTVLGGDPDETISSAAGKVAFLPADPATNTPWRISRAAPMWARFVVWFVMKVDPTHYPRTIETDEGKNSL